jgi:DNA-binding transcriptional regulator YhcF (GntR family)
MRGRILRGLQAGTVRKGDRLPASRELAREFDVDNRVVLAAYRTLADEGTIELRPRGGVYVTGKDREPAFLPPPAGFVAEVLAQGINHEIAIGEMHDWLRRSVETLRLRAVVIQMTGDQIIGLCRELRDYYGIEATGIDGEALRRTQEAPVELRYADLVVTTPMYEEIARPFADRLGKPVIVVDIRSDLIGGEWRALLKNPVYVIVKDERFIAMMEHFFVGTPGAENLRPLLVGRDSLDVIPEDAAVYITASAQEELGNTPVRGNILPLARVLSRESSLELIRFVVDTNFKAMAAIIKS